MNFAIKPWENGPFSATPLDGASMQDLEQRLSSYVDAKRAEIQAGVMSAQYESFNQDQLTIISLTYASTNPPDRVAFALEHARVVLISVQINAWHPATGNTVPGLFLDDAIVINERNHEVNGGLGAGIEVGAILKPELIADGTIFYGSSPGPARDHGMGLHVWLEAGSHTAEIKYKVPNGAQGFISQRHLVVAT